MTTYVIRRLNAWSSPEELQRVAARSGDVAENEFPDDIRWIRSYVIAEKDGTLGTVCIYQASDPEAVRRHAHRVGMPADEILDVADLVVNRPDPEWEPATAAGSRLMSDHDTVETLVLDLLEWIAPNPRPYAEALEAWRTSCPRLPVWEEATDRGFIVRQRSYPGGALVSVSTAGADHLRKHRRRAGGPTR